MRATPRPSRDCAGGSTGSRWRWSWRRPASGRSASTSSSPGSTTGSGCWPPGTGTPRRGSRPCGPSSTGAGSCSPSRNGWCCGGWQWRQTAATCGPPRRSAPKMTWMCSACCPGWSTALSSWSQTGRAGETARTSRMARDTGCWRAWPRTACSACGRRGSTPRCGGGTASSTVTSLSARHPAFAAMTSGPGSGAWTPRPPTCALRSIPRLTTATSPPLSGWPMPWPGTGSSAAGWRRHGAPWMRHWPSVADQLPPGPRPRPGAAASWPSPGSASGWPPRCRLAASTTPARGPCWIGSTPSSHLISVTRPWPRRCSSSALADFRAQGDQWGIAAALSTHAKVAMIRGDRAAARAVRPAEPGDVPRAR